MNILNPISLSVIFTFISLIHNQVFSQELTKQKVDSLYDVGWEYLNKNSDSSIYIGNIQKKLAIEIGYELGLVNAHYLLGYAYYNKLHYDQAAINFYNGIDIIKEKSSVEFKRKKLFLLQFLGVIYRNTYNYENSSEYYIKALQLAEELDNKESLGDLHYNIAINFWKNGDYKTAEGYYQKSILVSEEINDKYRIAKVYNLIGAINAETGNYDLAKENYLKALAIGKDVEALKRDLLMFKVNLGEVYFKQNQFDLAKKIYLESLEPAIELNDIEKIKWIYNNLGEVYYAENNLELAIDYYKRTIALKSSDAVDEKAQKAFKKVSELYETLDKYKLALEYKSGYLYQADKIIALKENLAEQNAQYRMKEIELQREIMQQELMLASAEKENLWGRIIIGVALLLIIFSSRLIYVYYSKISKARKIVNSYRVESFDF